MDKILCSILIMLLTCFMLVLTGHAEDIDCKPLDPRQNVSSEIEGKVTASATTLFKVAKAGGSINTKLRTEAKNLQESAQPSEQLAVKSRLIYLFCTLVANAPELSKERKFELFNQLNKSVLTQEKKNKLAPKSKPKSVNEQIERKKFGTESNKLSKTSQLTQVVKNKSSTSPIDAYLVQTNISSSNPNKDQVIQTDAVVLASKHRDNYIRQIKDTHKILLDQAYLALQIEYRDKIVNRTISNELFESVNKIFMSYAKTKEKILELSILVIQQITSHYDSVLIKSENLTNAQYHTLVIEKPIQQIKFNKLVDSIKAMKITNSDWNTLAQERIEQFILNSGEYN